MRPFWRKQGPSHWLGLCSLRRGAPLSQRGTRACGFLAKEAVDVLRAIDLDYLILADGHAGTGALNLRHYLCSTALIALSATTKVSTKVGL